MKECILKAKKINKSIHYTKNKSFQKKIRKKFINQKVKERGNARGDKTMRESRGSIE